MMSFSILALLFGALPRTQVEDNVGCLDQVLLVREIDARLPNDTDLENASLGVELQPRASDEMLLTLTFRRPKFPEQSFQRSSELKRADCSSVPTLLGLWLQAELQKNLLGSVTKAPERRPVVQQLERPKSGGQKALREPWWRFGFGVVGAVGAPLPAPRIGLLANIDLGRSLYFARISVHGDWSPNIPIGNGKARFLDASIGLGGGLHIGVAQHLIISTIRADVGYRSIQGLGFAVNQNPSQPKAEVALDFAWRTPPGFQPQLGISVPILRTRLNTQAGLSAEEPWFRIHIGIAFLSSSKKIRPSVKND